MLVSPPELPQLTIEQKVRRILELGDEALKEPETVAELTQMFSSGGEAASATASSCSSKEFLSAVEKSIGAPVIPKRFKVGR
ncbi:MAG TPA: hypothetical protein DIT64_10610 [Verrucomicrobiales bacterium]|nr:hypothetical protein [Verrucomicrobiales bacterium]